MLRASNRIEHGMKDKDGENVVVTLEPNQPVKGLPAEVVKNLLASGAIYDDAREEDENDEAKASKGGKGAKD